MAEKHPWQATIDKARESAQAEIEAEGIDGPHPPAPSPTGEGEKDEAAALAAKVAALEAEKEELKAERDGFAQLADMLGRVKDDLVAERDALQEAEVARKERHAGKIVILRNTTETELAEYLDGYSIQHMQFMPSVNPHTGVEGVDRLNVVLRRINGGPRDSEKVAAVEPDVESPHPLAPSATGAGEPETDYTYPVSEPEPEPVPAADGSHVAALTVFGLDDGPDVLSVAESRNFGGWFALRVAPMHNFTAAQTKAVMDGWHRWNRSVPGTVAS